MKEGDLVAFRKHDDDPTYAVDVIKYYYEDLQDLRNETEELFMLVLSVCSNTGMTKVMSHNGEYEYPSHLLEKIN